MILLRISSVPVGLKDFFNYITSETSKIGFTDENGNTIYYDKMGNSYEDPMKVPGIYTRKISIMKSITSAKTVIKLTHGIVMSMKMDGFMLTKMILCYLVTTIPTLMITNIMISI